MSAKPKILWTGSLVALLSAHAVTPSGAFSKAELHKACLDMYEACTSYCDKHYNAGSNAHKACTKDCKKQYDECGEKAWNMPPQTLKKVPKTLPELKPAD